MNKILLSFNIVFIVATFVLGLCYTFIGGFWLQFFAGLSVVLMTAMNLIFVLRTKAKNSRRYAYFIGAGAIFQFASILFLNVIPVSGLSLAFFSVLGYFIALVMLDKISWKDLVFAFGIALPLCLVVSYLDIFGYRNIFEWLLACLFVIVVSFLISKAISNLIKTKNSTNILNVVASSFMIISSIMLSVLVFTNTYSVIVHIYDIVNFIAQIIFAYSVFDSIRVHKNFDKKLIKYEKFSLKKAFKTSVLSLIITFLAGYSLLFSFVHFNVASAKVSKDKFLASVGENLEIPVVEINTYNNEIPKNKIDYVNCSFSIDYQNDEYSDFSVGMAKKYGDENSVGIKLRGNSTMLANKKPYRIKFDKKKSLFGLEANKNWVLLADYYDQSYIRNYAAFKIADEFDSKNEIFSPTGHHVALVLNGEFKGLYLLCEQMDENKGRADVKSDDILENVNDYNEFPFLVEIDVKAHLEGKTGVDNFYVDRFYPAEIKYPEADERGKTENSDKVFDYIKEYVNAVFETLQTGNSVEVSFRETPVNFEDLVDIDSAVHYYLVNEIMLNADSVWKSIYLSKTADGKMTFGPVWDFDYSMATDWKIPYKKSQIEDANKIHIAKYSGIFKVLLQSETFYNKVVSKFNECKQSILIIVEDLEGYKQKIDNVALIDTKMWHGKTGEMEYDMQFDYVRLFLSDRYDFLNYAFSKSHGEFLSMIN